MNLQNGSYTRPAASQSAFETNANLDACGKESRILTDSFSIREQIPKQRSMDYLQTCPICKGQFKSCMKSKLRTSHPDCYAQHLRKCMLSAPEDKLRQLRNISATIDFTKPDRRLLENRPLAFRKLTSGYSKADRCLRESLLKRRKKYQNMLKTSQMEISGIDRVLNVAFGENMCSITRLTIKKQCTGF